LLELDLSLPDDLGAAEPAVAAAEEGGEEAPEPEVTIKHLLGRHDATVRVRQADLDALYQDSDACLRAAHWATEELMTATLSQPQWDFTALIALARTHPAQPPDELIAAWMLRPPPELQRLHTAREAVAVAMTRWRDVAAELSAVMRQCHAAMDVLVCNEIYNHARRGPQDAPFRSMEQVEATEIGFDIANPALPNRRAPYVETLRTQTFF